MIALDNATTLARSAAASNGLELSPEALSAAADRLAADLTHDAGQLAFDGAAPFRIEAGQVVELGLVEHVLAVVREHGRPAAAPTSAPQTLTTKPGKPEVNTPIATLGRAFAASHDAAVVRETEAMTNPWLPGKINRTHQQIISNKNPDLAAHFKAQAGM